MPESYTQRLMNIMASYLKGEVIEWKNRTKLPSDKSNDWKEVDGTPLWHFDCYEYRVKPKLDIRNTKIYSFVSRLNNSQYDSTSYITSQIAICAARYAVDCMNDSHYAEEARNIVDFHRTEGVS